MSAYGYTYTGREWDKETGLYYYRARYYDPIEGRFISKDPAGFSGGINLYDYVTSDPINLKDPTGLASYSGTVELVGVGRFVAGGAYLSGTLHTECLNGKRYVGNVRAAFAGASVGIPVAATKFGLTVSDSASGIGNLNNLSGLASITSLSAALGPNGYSASRITLGQASTTPNDLLGKQIGLDLSASAMGGWAFVSNVHEEKCCQ